MAVATVGLLGVLYWGGGSSGNVDGTASVCPDGWL